MINTSHISLIATNCDSRIHEIFKCLQEASIKWETSSVQRYDSQPFLALIASMLSTQTREEKTILASNSLFTLANNPYSMVSLSECEIREAISNVSFYNTKAKNILKVCQRIINNNGVVPNELERLLEYEGVGWKVATLTLEVGYNNKDNICVDTHVSRISKRLGLVDLHIKTSKEIERMLKEKLPHEYWKPWNGLLVAFGRKTCKPLRPQCSNCIINHLCPKVGIE